MWNFFSGVNFRPRTLGEMSPSEFVCRATSSVLSKLKPSLAIPAPVVGSRLKETARGTPDRSFPDSVR